MKQFSVGIKLVSTVLLTLSLPTTVLYNTRISSAGEPAIGINAMDKSVYLFTESERVNISPATRNGCV